MGSYKVIAILTCEKCGNEIADGASFCAQCGSPVSVAQIGPVYVPPHAQPAESIPAIPPASVALVLPVYAGFWLRAAASLIDMVIIFVILMFAGPFFPSFFNSLPESNADLMLFMAQHAPFAIALICLGSLYFALFEVSSWQASPGKRIMRLYVTDLNGQRINIGRALIRNLAKQISGIAMIGYMIAGFTEKKQALHDIIAGCLVLRRR
jgi:uncharacterized RDD family membrane protein YckC